MINQTEEHKNILRKKWKTFIVSTFIRLFRGRKEFWVRESAFGQWKLPYNSKENNRIKKLSCLSSSRFLREVGNPSPWIFSALLVVFSCSVLWGWNSKLDSFLDSGICNLFFWCIHHFFFFFFVLLLVCIVMRKWHMHQKWGFVYCKHWLSGLVLVCEYVSCRCLDLFGWVEKEEKTGYCWSLYCRKFSPFGFLNVQTDVNMEKSRSIWRGRKVLWVFFSMSNWSLGSSILYPNWGNWKLRLVLLVGNFGPVSFVGLGEITVLQVLSPPKSTNSSM